MAVQQAERRGGGITSAANLLACIGVALLAIAFLSQDPAPPAPDSAATISVRHAAPMPSSRPVSIAIPALGVDAPVERLGVDTEQRLEVPAEAAVAGWYRESSAPGSAGSAVIAGHVTWEEEPAVFFELGALRPGQRVHVRRADGRTAVFAVTKVAQYPKGEFPTAKIYRPVDEPELRLITCGGRYDADSDSYSDNVVAYAALVGTRS